MASNKRTWAPDGAQGARSTQQKRRKQVEPLTRNHYNIGWVSALPIELAAGVALLDDRHEALPKPVGDGNAYFYGTVGGHNVVMACLPDDLPSPSSATKVAADMCRSFTKLRLLLLVGIGGGIPRPGCDVRLGDVVVGRRVIQHDLGKEISGDRFEATGVACIPSRDIRTTLSSIKVLAEMGQNPLPRVLNELGSRGLVSREYFDRSQLEDHLFENNYRHIDETTDCSKCDTTQRVIKNAKVRDEIGGRHQALCVEMEAAGLVHDFPFLAIRGICDYADSHKNDSWQKYAATTAAAYGMEFLRNCQPIESSPEPISSASQRRDKLIETLQFPRSKARYEDIHQAQSTTCAWFLQDSVYQEWIKPTNFAVHRGFLWIRGKPGAGKSTLMKYLFDEALATAGPDDVVVGFFYHARGNLLERSVTGMYRSLIVQLLERDLSTVTTVDLFDGIEEDDLVCNNKSLHRLFSRLVKAFDGPRLAVFIDALDEGDVDECQLMIENVEELASSARDQGVRLDVCFASRHHHRISLDSSLQLVLEDQPGHQRDLQQYVTNKLHQFPSQQIHPLTDKILQKAQGSFLWVVIVVRQLRRELSRGFIQEDQIVMRLEETPSEVVDLYDDMISLDGMDTDAFRVCMYWLLYGRQQMRPEEFYFAVRAALAMPGSESDVWDPEQMPVEIIQKFITSLSKGLAETTMSRNRLRTVTSQTMNPTARETTPIVQFIHETVREFVMRNSLKLGMTPTSTVSMESHIHDQLKLYCNNALINTEINMSTSEAILQEEVRFYNSLGMEAPAVPDNALPKVPFLPYAFRNVLFHSETAAVHIPQADFLKSFNHMKWSSSGFLLFQSEQDSMSELLQFVIEANLWRTLKEILKIHEIDDLQSIKSLVDSAVRHQNLEVLQVVHGHVEGTTLWPQMLLHDAVSKDSNVAILEFLIQTGADIWACDGSQSTALHAAAQVGHSLAITLLLAQTSARGKTPASSSVRRTESGDSKSKTLQQEHPPGETAIVNERDEYMRTALHYAAGNLRPRAVQVLLEDKDIQVDLVDEDDRTALHLALQYRSDLRATGLIVPTIELLLRAGCPPNKTDTNGLTAIDYALGHDFLPEAASVLLTTGAAIDAQSEGAEKLLDHAAQRGWDETFLLLASKGTPIREPTYTLGLAAGGNSINIASWILAHAERRRLPSKRDVALGQVRFHFGVPKAGKRLRAGFGAEKCCDEQHDVRDAAVSHPGTVKERIVQHCCQAVQYAAKPGNVAMVALLLESVADLKSCCCVLHVAVSLGDTEAVTALVAKGAPLAGCRVALSIAARAHDARMASLLQTLGADPASFGRALRTAVESESVEVASLLMRDNPGLVASSRALQMAAELGKHTMTTFFLRQNRSSSNIYDTLLGAVRRGDAKTTMALVGELKDAPGADAATLLKTAVEEGKLALAALLVDKGITLNDCVTEFATWRHEDSHLIPRLLKPDAEATLSAELSKASDEKPHLKAFGRLILKDLFGPGETTNGLHLYPQVAALLRDATCGKDVLGLAVHSQNWDVTKALLKIRLPELELPTTIEVVS